MQAELVPTIQVGKSIGFNRKRHRMLELTDYYGYKDESFTTATGLTNLGVGVRGMEWNESEEPWQWRSVYEVRLDIVDQESAETNLRFLSARLGEPSEGCNRWYPGPSSLLY